MGLENVCCPNCGKEAFATVPSGHRLVRIQSRSNRPYCDVEMQECMCPHCKETFYAVTIEKD